MSENREIYDITIIGGGPVGLFAAFYAGLRGVSVKIIESLSELGGQPAVLYPEKMIYDVAGFPGITAADLTENLIKQLDRFKDSTAICLKEEVKTFEKDGDIFTIETNKGQHVVMVLLPLVHLVWKVKKLMLTTTFSTTFTNLTNLLVKM